MAEKGKYDRSAVIQVQVINSSFVDLARSFGEQFGQGTVHCIQSFGPGRFQVTLDSVSTAERVKENGVLLAGEKIFPRSVNEPGIWITVRNAPFQMPASDVSACLAPYGDVLFHEFVVPREIAPIANGDRRIKFRMKRPVPNFLKWGPFTLMLTYAGVVRTCRRCGREGHLAAMCKGNFCTGCRKGGHVLEECEVTDQIVVLNDKEFPPLGGRIQHEKPTEDVPPPLVEEQEEPQSDWSEEEDQTMEEEAADNVERLAEKDQEQDGQKEMDAAATAQEDLEKENLEKQETSSSSLSDSSVVSVKKQGTEQRGRAVYRFTGMAYDKYREAVLSFFGEYFIRAKWIGTQMICIEYIDDGSLKSEMPKGFLVEKTIVRPISWDTSKIWSDDDEEEEEETPKRRQRRSRKVRKKRQD